MSGQSLLLLRKYIAIVHHIPGRLRVRIDRRVLTASPTHSVADIQSMIAGIDGIFGIRVSAATLSAVIEYDRHRVPPDVWTHVIEGADEVARAAFATLCGAQPSEEPSND